MQIRKWLFVIISFLLIVFVSCNDNKDNSRERYSFIIEDTTSKNWRFVGGELLGKDSRQEFKYSKVEYIGEDDIIDTIFVEFYICKMVDSSDTDRKMDDINETLYTHSESIEGGFNINSFFSFGDGGIEGELLNPNYEYDFNQIFMKITYKKDGDYSEETIKLPMKRMIYVH